MNKLNFYFITINVIFDWTYKFYVEKTKRIENKIQMNIQ